MIQLSGCLDFETAQPFRDDLATILRSSKNTQVVFDFSELSFVGSCGITAFVQALREFNNRAPTRPRYINVQSEFRRIISAFDANQSFDFGIHEN